MVVPERPSNDDTPSHWNASGCTSLRTVAGPWPTYLAAAHAVTQKSVSRTVTSTLWPPFGAVASPRPLR